MNINGVRQMKKETRKSLGFLAAYSTNCMKRSVNRSTEKKLLVVSPASAIFDVVVVVVIICCVVELRWVATDVFSVKITFIQVHEILSNTKGKPRFK